MSVPDVASAGETAYRLLAARAVSIRRFPTGSCHWVFDVQLETGNSVVLRMTTASLRPAMHGALLMNELLRPKGVPLPRLLHADLNGQFPTLVLERLAGTDLTHVMRELDDSMLEAIADRVAAAQEVVASLPSAGHYGYAVEAAAAPCASWPDFLGSSLERSRCRLSENGLFSLKYADRVEALLEEVQLMASHIEAVPFLHDTTTKNVIITSEGRFSGIVHVDDLCWGDPRFAPALTLASMQAFGGPRHYVAAWLRRAGFKDDRLFRTYVALCALDLVAEQGKVFNGNEVKADAEQQAHLLAALECALEQHRS